MSADGDAKMSIATSQPSLCLELSTSRTTTRVASMHTRASRVCIVRTLLRVYYYSTTTLEYAYSSYYLCIL